MNTQLPENELVECTICLKEIPASEATEAVDYVAHFCGLACYAQWQKNSERDAEDIEKS